MRVLLVGNHFRSGTGGAETVLVTTKELLEQAGCDVVPFAFAEPATEPTAWLPWFPPAPPGSERRWPGGLSSVYSWTARRHLEALVREVRPDIAHLHSVHDRLTLSVVDALRGAGVPIVFTVHDYRPVCPAYRLLTGGEPCTRCVAGGRYWNAVVHRCREGSLRRSVTVAAESYLSRIRGQYGKVDVFVAPSRFLRDVLVTGGFPGDRITVVPNPAVARPPRREPSRPARFVYFGRLVPEKGLDVLLRASRMLRSGAVVDIFGAGPLEADLRRRVAAERLPVEVHGFATMAVIGPVLGEATAAVLPALWHENCPMAVLEAAAHGVATIGTPLGGIPDLVDSGRDGVLVPERDPASLAAAMDRLAAEPALAVAMGRRARDRARGVHSPERYVASLLDCYDRAITAGSPAPA